MPWNLTLPLLSALHSAAHYADFLPFLLPGRDPALLERHWADIAQRRVQSFVVIKIGNYSAPV